MNIPEFLINIDINNSMIYTDCDGFVKRYNNKKKRRQDVSKADFEGYIYESHMKFLD